jgi:hypothetical protein
MEVTAGMVGLIYTVAFIVFAAIMVYLEHETR